VEEYYKWWTRKEIEEKIKKINNWLPSFTKNKKEGYNKFDILDIRD